MRCWRALTSSRTPIQPYHPLDFNSAGPQTDYYRDLIENGAPEGERSEKFQEVVWHLAAMGWTIEQIVDELAKYPNGIGVEVCRSAAARSQALVREMAESPPSQCDRAPPPQRKHALAADPDQVQASCRAS